MTNADRIALPDGTSALGSSARVGVLPGLQRHRSFVTVRRAAKLALYWCTCGSLSTAAALPASQAAGRRGAVVKMRHLSGVRATTLDRFWSKDTAAVGFSLVCAHVHAHVV